MRSEKMDEQFEIVMIEKYASSSSSFVKNITSLKD